ncbi:MAG: LiaI-LiaF-like domain-containing protein [Hyphomicrobiales bacterium]
MGFAKLALGVLLVGVGAILLAGHLGFLPSGSGSWLLQYWPILLVAIGLALLANAIKNAVLGWIATIVVVAALGFGAWWAYHHATPSRPAAVTSFDLDRPRVETLTLRARAFGGAIDVDAGAPGDATRRLELTVRGAGGSPDAHRYRASNGAALLDWPAAGTHSYQAPIGADVAVHAPARIGLRLETKSLFSSVRADLARLRPERCDFDAKVSNVRVDAAGAARPTSIRLRGFLSRAEILLPANAPVRLVVHAPLTWTSVPDDFLGHAPGRSHDQIWTADGAGRVITIDVEAPLTYLRVKRAPQSAL